MRYIIWHGSPSLGYWNVQSFDEHSQLKKYIFYANRKFSFKTPFISICLHMLMENLKFKFALLQYNTKMENRKIFLSTCIQTHTSIRWVCMIYMGKFLWGKYYTLVYITKVKCQKQMLWISWCKKKEFMFYWNKFCTNLYVDVE